MIIFLREYMDINNNEMLNKFICNSLDDTRGIAL